VVDASGGTEILVLECPGEVRNCRGNGSELGIAVREPCGGDMDVDGARGGRGADKNDEAAAIEMVLGKQERFVVCIAAVVSGDDLRGP